MTRCSRFDQKRDYQKHMVLGSAVPAVLVCLLIAIHYSSSESVYRTEGISAYATDSSEVLVSGQRSWSGKSFPDFGVRYVVVPDEPVVAKKTDSSQFETPGLSLNHNTDDLFAGIPVSQFRFPIMELEKPVSVRDQSRPPSVKVKTSLDGVLLDDVTILLSIDSNGRVIPPSDTTIKTIVYYVKAAENREVVFHVERGKKGDVKTVIAEIARFWEFNPALDKNGNACSGELRLIFIPLGH